MGYVKQDVYRPNKESSHASGITTQLLSVDQVPSQMGVRSFNSKRFTTPTDSRRKADFHTHTHTHIHTHTHAHTHTRIYTHTHIHTHTHTRTHTHTYTENSHLVTHQFIVAFVIAQAVNHIIDNRHRAIFEPIYHKYNRRTTNRKFVLLSQGSTCARALSPFSKWKSITSHAAQVRFHFTASLIPCRLSRLST